MSSMLQSTLEAVVDVDKFPKASVDVNVLVLQVGWGGDATINCWGSKCSAPKHVTPATHAAQILQKVRAGTATVARACA